MILIFLSALTVGFSGAMMPGPLLTYTINQSLTCGPRSGVIIALGHALLELVLIILVFLGLDIVLKSSAAQIIIGILGGLLLIYTGSDMILRSVKNKVSIQLNNKKADMKNLLFPGIAISATNPYFLLWWAVIGLGFVMQSYDSLGYMGVVVYYIGHISADFMWYGIISVIVGTTRKFIKEKPYRTLLIILGCLIVFFGGSFLYNAISKLI